MQGLLLRFPWKLIAQYNAVDAVDAVGLIVVLKAEYTHCSIILLE